MSQHVERFAAAASGLARAERMAQSLSHAAVGLSFRSPHPRILIFARTRWEPRIMSPGQCRAARALLRWSTFQLADKAGVPQQTVRDFQAGRRIPTAASIQAVRRTFEDAGVDFYRRADAEWVAAKPGVVEPSRRA
jgi:hypothetical protein